MKWELGALKILARNEMVPGIALIDAIGEIERLQVVVARLHEELHRQALVRNEDRIEIRMLGPKKFRQRVINLVAGVLEDVEGPTGGSLSLSSSIDPEDQ